MPITSGGGGRKAYVCTFATGKALEEGEGEGEGERERMSEEEVFFCNARACVCVCLLMRLVRGY